MQQQGDRQLVEQNQRIAGAHQALGQEWEQLNSALLELVPSGDSDDLGELGEMSADEYRDKLNDLLHRRQMLLRRQAGLAAQHEAYTRRRTHGGYAIFLDSLAGQPLAAAKVLDMLQGYEGFPSGAVAAAISGR